MSAVSETIVREYLELHGFFVRQQRKFVAPSKREDDDIDFLVVNPHYEAQEKALPFVLSSRDLSGVARAVVAVKGWHTETFSSAVIAHAPEIFRFVKPQSFRQAEKTMGEGGPVTKILVVPSLPQGVEARDQSIELLRSKGIDAVIPFQTMLSDLIVMTETNRNYQKSDLLQIIRILKNYDFFKDPQMELFKPKRKKRE